MNETKIITWIPFQSDIASHFNPLHNPFLEVLTASVFGSSETSEVTEIGVGRLNRSTMFSYTFYLIEPIERCMPISGILIVGTYGILGLGRLTDGN